MLKPLDWYVCLAISRPFFSSTFPRPVHAWIESKLILTDLVRENGRSLIKIQSIIILVFFYSFYIFNGGGTLGMFSTSPGNFRADFPLRMETRGP